MSWFPKTTAVVRASLLIKLMLTSMNWLVSDGCHNVSAGLLARSHKWWQMIVAYTRESKHNDSSSRYSTAAGFFGFGRAGSQEGVFLYVLQLQFWISCVLRFSPMFFCCFYVLQRSHMYSCVLHLSCIASSYILLFTSTFLIICSFLMFPQFFPRMKERSSVVYHLLRVFIFSQTSSHLSCFHTIPSVTRLARLLSAATSPLLFPRHCHPLPPLPPPLSPVSPFDFFQSLSCSSPSSSPAAAAVSHPSLSFISFSFCPTRHSATWRQKTEDWRWWCVRVHLHINPLHSSPFTRDNWKEVFPRTGQPPVFKCRRSKQSEKEETKRALSGL